MFIEVLENIALDSCEMIFFFFKDLTPHKKKLNGAIKHLI